MPREADSAPSAECGRSKTSKSKSSEDKKKSNKAPDSSSEESMDEKGAHSSKSSHRTKKEDRKHKKHKSKPASDESMEGESSSDEDGKSKSKSSRSLSKSSSKPSDVKCDLSKLYCTACSKQLNPNNHGSVKRHPVLKVLICKKCYNWYTSDEIEQDSDGMDEQCRWCGDGGNLLCCDYCNNAFCKNCIKRNLGRSVLSEIMDADDSTKWHCFVCTQKPLNKLIAEAALVINTLEEQRKKEKAAAKRADERKKHLESIAKATEERAQEPPIDTSTKCQDKSKIKSSKSTTPGPIATSTPVKGTEKITKFSIPASLVGEILDIMSRNSEASFANLTIQKSRMQSAQFLMDPGQVSDIKDIVGLEVQKILKSQSDMHEEIQTLIKKHNQAQAAPVQRLLGTIALTKPKKKKVPTATLR